MRASDDLAAAPPILETVGLSVVSPRGGSILADDLCLHAGELHLVHSPTTGQSAALADALLGLAGAGAGQVRFLGLAWADVDAAAACRVRSRIGRVMSSGNWLENRSVMENLLLPLRHQTVLAEEIIRQRASELALSFGLPGIPTLLPHQCSESDLERAACVRAFLGRPKLLVLEQPIEATESKTFPPLINAVQQLRRRRGAIIWFTHKLSLLEEPGISADRRYRIAGSRLLQLEACA
jgi:phospholipid/cholesterol/gamma-HCH transport system ATP-binding protein